MKFYILLAITSIVIIAIIILVPYLIARKTERKQRMAAFNKKMESLSCNYYKKVTVYESGDVILDTMLRNVDVSVKIDEDNRSIVHMKISTKTKETVQEKSFVFSIYDIIDIIKVIE